MALSLDSALRASASALEAHSTKVDVAANNVANVNTSGFKPSRVHLEDQTPNGVRASVEPSAGRKGAVPDDSGVDLAQEHVSLVEARAGFGASVAALRTESALLGTLVDALA